ncbi:hypothetical protein AAW12_16075 [Sphingobacterium sp. Ag1]|uniref:hypothetical protein n=1 Tax=Sphingobacterium sp. Ag1 TaxID=1643451 RepID=UPI0006278785|nr:hypothetical protein [Sphingobacterium sp. Ag1]KKO90592.1 hypothetical protein AAW12_16075 [Sphingobacterium sp. Ag1]
MKSITQIHVDVSTPKKAKKVAAILMSFPTRVKKIVLHRLSEGAVPYSRYALIGCVGRLQIWDFVEPSGTHEVISPKKLKKMLSGTSSGKAADPIKDLPKDIHDMIKESLECPPFSTPKPFPTNGVSIRKIFIDEGKGIDGMTLERLHKLWQSSDRTQTVVSDFAKKMANDHPIRVRFSPIIPFSEFFAKQSPSFPQPFIDHWKNTLFNFPLPPFKNVLKEWLKSEEEKAIAMKIQKEAVLMPKVGDLVKAYDDVNIGMTVDFGRERPIEDKYCTVGILTDISFNGSAREFRVNDGHYWNYAETITLEEARNIYGIKKSC